MTRTIKENYVNCFFHPVLREAPNGDDRIDVFFSEASHIEHSYHNLRHYLTACEQLRADRFHFEADRKIYVLCHALLRLVLSRRLSVPPLDLDFSSGSHNKPFLPGNPLYFNLSHTKEAFAFAVSKRFYVGIDLENINRNIDFNIIADTCFNTSERKFMNKLSTKSRERFFLLWTRKEAFLKATGTGLIADLKKIPMCEKRNIISHKLKDEHMCNNIFPEHFIYSKKMMDYYLSVAIPQVSPIYITQFTAKNVPAYLI
jgi:4'-phosphopantetheinyl transferase